MEIQVVNFDKIFLSHSWEWLNEPELKKLTNTPDFTQEDQLRWYESLKYKNDYLVWGILADSKPIGVCGLKKITQTDCEYWGYIGEKEYWGKGIGKSIMYLLEEEAKKLKLNSIWLQVLQENSRAILLYKKTGYQIDKIERGLIFMRKPL